jgi:hypothetical protein
MYKIFILILIVITQAYPQRGRLIPNPLKNIPRWARTEFKNHRLDNNYTITFRYYPHYYKGDFNNDKRKDIALQITNNESGKSGIVIIHGKKPQAISTTYAILGAGKLIGKAGDDFKWADRWLYNDTNSRDEIMLISNRSRKGKFIWNGSTYEWHAFK